MGVYCNREAQRNYKTVKSGMPGQSRALEQNKECREPQLAQNSVAILTLQYYWIDIEKKRN